MSAPAIHVRPEPAGGRLVTPGTIFLGFMVALCGLAIVYRFAFGLGASTALTDGYPWGIWIAVDVVTGTALACGGYALAILIYVLNKGQYHPLIRPAILTSALGYSMAGFSICLDVGRPWLLYRVPTWFHNWNLHSVLFEVAMCVMAYVVVCWIEIAPAFLEKFRDGNPGVRQTLAAKILPILKTLMPAVVALGLLLPTMHQSSLGSLMLLTGRKLHPLWAAPILPLLFLVSCIGMGYAAIVFAATLSARYFRRTRETAMLAGLAQAMIPVLVLFSPFRFVDLLVRGRLGLLFALDRYAFLFWLETALFVAPIFMVWKPERRISEANLFRVAMMLMLAGGLYRFDTFLIAFNPGANYSYFPSVAEILITAGLVAFEILTFILAVKLFPILAGAPKPAAAKT